MGDPRGKRLLDVGAELGESSVYFALRGAEVTASIFRGMVRCAVALGHCGVKIDGVVSGEELNVPNYYDIVYVANTIHHVTDKDRLFWQIRQALKPGGRFFSFDPLAYNPVIEIYRRMATKVRTEDEAPLTFADVERAGKYFAGVQHREFWILTLSLFQILPRGSRPQRGPLEALPESPRLYGGGCRSREWTRFSRVPSPPPAWNMVMWVKT